MARFHYTANALGLGAKFVRDGVSTTIGGETSLVLPNTGGSVTMQTSNFDYRGVSFLRASATAHGWLDTTSRREAVYRTELHFRIDDLQILDTVHVGHLAVRLVSEHPAPVPPHSTRALGDDQIHISLGEGSGFGAVVAAGSSLKVHDRAAEFGAKLRTFKQIFDAETALGRKLAGRTRVDTSLVAGIDTSLHVDNFMNNEERRCYVSVPGFGRLFFGEVLASKDSRRINLLRVELDSDEGGNPNGEARTAARGGGTLKGDLVAGAAEINGSSYP